jgi:CRISPR-associated protein Csb2
VLPILKALSVPPVYHLPPASAAHTRSFLSSNEKDPSKKQLIFDAFAVIERNEKVVMGLNSGLTSGPLNSLIELLSELNYLGRSESWVRVSVAESKNDYRWNCLPATGEQNLGNGEYVQVACLLPPEEYENLSHQQDWLKAICMSTKELLSEGWSNPPAMRWVDYIRPEGSLVPKPAVSVSPLKAKFRCAKYALYSTVLPRVQDTVPFAERIRSFLMGIHKRVMGDDPAAVSRLFSGKNSDGTPMKDHRHVFIQPLDEDGDGRLDHLLIYANEAFSSSELAALDRLQSVWQPKRRPDVEMVLISLLAERSIQRSKKWISVTPFVTGRHYRKGRGTFKEWLCSEIVKECSFHNLPEPQSIEWVSHTVTSRRPLRWAEYVRSRKNGRPLPGYGCILEFEKAVSGPFAIGSACHFGLGLFMPYDESR